MLCYVMFNFQKSYPGRIKFNVKWCIMLITLLVDLGLYTLVITVCKQGFYSIEQETGLVWRFKDYVSLSVTARVINSLYGDC